MCMVARSCSDDWPRIAAHPPALRTTGPAVSYSQHSTLPASCTAATPDSPSHVPLLLWACCTDTDSTPLLWHACFSLPIPHPCSGALAPPCLTAFRPLHPCQPCLPVVCCTALSLDHPLHTSFPPHRVCCTVTSSQRTSCWTPLATRRLSSSLTLDSLCSSSPAKSSTIH